MAKLADVTEAPLLLPQGADRLATHGRLTVSKRAAVTLSTGGIVVKVAVISLHGHSGTSL